MILLSYLLIFATIVVWCLLLPSGKKMPQPIVDGITIFGGAFLLASCFINLIPHIYVSGFSTPTHHIKIGVTVLIGFLIQLMLEHFTDHKHHSSDHNPQVTGLLIGLSIHAFLEGMPLVDHNGEIHQSLLYGIILHNIPLTLVLVSLFSANKFSFGKSLTFLMLFAVMTPLGSLLNIYCLPDNATVQALIMGIVVGILIHVSVSILFNHHDNSFRWWKVALIIIAFTAAYFTPGCPEIYG